MPPRMTRELIRQVRQQNASGALAKLNPAQRERLISSLLHEIDMQEVFRAKLRNALQEASRIAGDSIDSGRASQARFDLNAIRKVSDEAMRRTEEEALEDLSKRLSRENMLVAATTIKNIPVDEFEGGLTEFRDEVVKALLLFGGLSETALDEPAPAAEPAAEATPETEAPAPAGEADADA